MNHESLEIELTREELEIVDNIFKEIHIELSDEINDMSLEEADSATFLMKIKSIFEKKLKEKIKDKKRQELVMGAYNFLPEALSKLKELREKLEKHRKELRPDWEKANDELLEEAAKIKLGLVEEPTSKEIADAKQATYTDPKPTKRPTEEQPDLF